MTTGLSLDTVFSQEPAAKVANLLTFDAGTEQISKLAGLARPFHCGPEKPGNPEQAAYTPAKGLSKNNLYNSSG